MTGLVRTNRSTAGVTPCVVLHKARCAPNIDPDIDTPRSSASRVESPSPSDPGRSAPRGQGSRSTFTHPLTSKNKPRPYPSRSKAFYWIREQRPHPFALNYFDKQRCRSARKDVCRRSMRPIQNGMCIGVGLGGRRIAFCEQVARSGS